VKIFDSISAAKTIKNPILTLGTFDGVHLGHQHVLQQLNDLALVYDGESTLLTFEPHPRIVLHPDNHELQLIQTFEEKKEKLRQSGLKNLICIPFTKEFGMQTATEFIENILVNALNIKAIVIGYDHRFGKDRTGDFQLLLEMGNLHGFAVLQTDAYELNNHLISSTKIRKALQIGEIQRANSYLGQTFSLTGNVIRGQEKGRTIGFPTANLDIPNKIKLIPALGVYCVSVTLSGLGLFKGMLNIGNRPTLNDDRPVSIEVYILDFNGDLYDESITIHFHTKIRDEQQFINLESLKGQLISDTNFVRTFFESVERSAH
jgi:riboflavin kinase/FMN adenylyltransferase